MSKIPNLPSIEFEVIDQYGGMHRFNRSHGYTWEFRLEHGSIDKIGNEFLDVYKHFEDGDEGGEGRELFATFPNPAKVGEVDDNTCLTMPLREKQLEQCPRCGFINKGENNGL